MNDWQPVASINTARQRASLLRSTRHYFDEQQVLAVDMPSLSFAAVSDVNIESFSVHSLLDAKPRYLQTSPEFHMKRLLADGFPDIYCICRVFRDGESGRRHLPEFTMIEWYRLGFDLQAIVNDTLGLIAATTGQHALARDVERLDYADAFQRYVGVDPLTATFAELAQAACADESLRVSLGKQRNDWLDLILATCIAPQFPRDRLTVLQHYPIEQAALARPCPANARLADRFEVFYGDLELANGYVELTDGTEQLRRFESDQCERLARKLPVRPLDATLLAALDAGLPACAGVALGFERLQMLNDGVDDMRKVVCFP